MRWSSAPYSMPRRDRGVGEVLAARELRVRVGLDHVDLPRLGEPQVDARVAAQVEDAVDALAERLDARARARRGSSRAGPLAMPCFFW